MRRYSVYLCDFINPEFLRFDKLRLIKLHAKRLILHPQIKNSYTPGIVYTAVDFFPLLSEFLFRFRIDFRFRLQYAMRQCSVLVELTLKFLDCILAVKLIN